VTECYLWERVCSFPGKG